MDQGTIQIGQGEPCHLEVGTPRFVLLVGRSIVINPEQLLVPWVKKDPLFGMIWNRPQCSKTRGLNPNWPIVNLGQCGKLTAEQQAFPGINQQTVC